jgi:hypothetical protein
MFTNAFDERPVSWESSKKGLEEFMMIRVKNASLEA